MESEATWEKTTALEAGKLSGAGKSWLMVGLGWVCFVHKSCLFPREGRATPGASHMKFV